MKIKIEYDQKWPNQFSTAKDEALKNVMKLNHLGNYLTDNGLPKLGKEAFQISENLNISISQMIRRQYQITLNK